MRRFATLIVRVLLSAPRLGVGSTALLLCLAAGAQAPAAIKYRSVEYSFAVSSAAAEFNGSERRVWWEYPVFEMPEAGVRDALNAWARKASLEALASGAEVALEILENKTDREVMQFLAQSLRFVESGVDQSVVTPNISLGVYVTADYNTEWVGGNRPLHAVEVLYFNTATRMPIKIQSLFRAEALGVLNDELSKIIARARDSGRRPACSGRRFDWHQVSLVSRVQLGVSFPYDPAEWAACGDGVEMIEGKVVARQLLRPASLSPTRRIEQTNLGAPPQKFEPLSPAAIQAPSTPRP